VCEGGLVMDIFNRNERDIRCIRNDKTVMGGSKWNHLLEVGKIYHIDFLDVRSWHTDVYLKEFPGMWFNSVLFEEIDEEDK
jgi:hypothetical protein